MASAPVIAAPVKTRPTAAGRVAAGPVGARTCKASLAAVMVVLVFGLVACSSSPSTPATSASTSAAASSGGASSASGGAHTPSAGAGPSGSLTIPGAPTKITGTITAGVEANCFVLTDDSGAVVANLIGVDKASAPLDTKVVVSGKFEPDLMTTCQQGTPFAVAVIEQP